MIINIESKLVPYERRLQNLCKYPYPGHPDGCPNYGIKEGCPGDPKKPIPLLDEVLDFGSEVYVICTEFGVGKFAERMRQKHPEWTQKQIYNSQYWQPRARKEHREELERFLEDYEGMNVISCPEAHGVNVTGLMQNIGIRLSWGEWPPKHSLENKVYRVSLAGKPIEL